MGDFAANRPHAKKTQTDRPGRCREGSALPESPPHAGVRQPLEIGPALRRDRFQPAGVA
jgi:hypothetical protein